VLLLNSTDEPLTALPMRRAVIMLMCGKADVVHDDPAGPVIHSATRTIVVPVASPSGHALFALRHTSSDRQSTTDWEQSHDNSARVRWSVQ